MELPSKRLKYRIYSRQHYRYHCILSYEPAHVKRGLTEFEVEFKIAMDLCREKSHEYGEKKQN